MERADADERRARHDDARRHARVPADGRVHQGAPPEGTRRLDPKALVVGCCPNWGAGREENGAPIVRFAKGRTERFRRVDEREADGTGDVTGSFKRDAEEPVQHGRHEVTDALVATTAESGWAPPPPMAGRRGDGMAAGNTNLGQS